MDIGSGNLVGEGVMYSNMDEFIKCFRKIEDFNERIYEIHDSAKKPDFY